MTRPCKLQINQTGAWRDVVRFDLDGVDEVALTATASHLVQIADPAGRTTLRIVVADVYAAPLLRWDREKGWRPW